VLRIADIGTGSGALLIALLRELPAAHGFGTDISLGALACARDNARTLGCAARASFLSCDYGTALAGPFDLIVCNPPYVARGEIEGLAPEVRVHDPRRALDGGPDGLDGYRALAADVRRLLAPEGVLVVELGADQLAAVSALFTKARLAIEAVRHDLSGVGRALMVKPLP
jgi:release factor glutamine methyltransferase